MHVLQSTLMPAPGLPEALYLRLTDGARDCALRRGCDGPLGLMLRPGQVLSTDTFFGSFHMAVWRAHTPVREVAVIAHFRGQGEARVFEHGPDGVRLLATVPLDDPAGGRFVVPCTPATRDPGLGGAPPPSRLTVEVEATRPSQLHGLDIVSPTAPRHRATLSVGLCTFNQEARLARTLAGLVRLAGDCDAIRAVHLVNQGVPFADPEIRTLLAHPKIRAVRQRNLGGCGGFTRGLAAALADPDPATHHLMMDDDIVLDPRMIPRALRFLDHAGDRIALGAGMLDALRPTVMYEAGAFLRPDNTIAPHARDADLADPAQLSCFDAPVATDYNAWWFCILPQAACRGIGLPAPVFIRGDDFEYGQRLAGAGVPTVTLPGIAVWHEPFYAKPQGWQSYYDLRNRLIFAATHPGRVRQLSLAHVAGLITTAILTHAHATAELRLRAVEDFLTGPGALFARDPEALHAEVMAINRHHAPERLEDSAWAAAPLAPARPRSTTMAGLIAQQAWSLVRTGLGPLRRGGAVVLLDVDAHPANTAGRAYVLTNDARSFHLRLVPRRGRMWGLMRRTVAVVRRYARQRAAANAAWAGGIAPYRTPAWWARLFASAEAP
ncbi:glycosyltransferase family 2 protein [Rhodobaculum claviforme]|uniref:Galactofuranosylgalactofuranosylrhamnosyl-N-acetylglucosaminyl-diphospho-decaprenol beta-1,5/1,6-galactofuranosyltransferase n=1 Tax=Rhodobaculum claviforme TaxID=1549854 RepID=A0A934TMU3_9RHOB|nr:glycosyltransferase [Rhodobaculum claviforme]MBK5928449.1 hypothetical protein [Rhodobaculum claviforme]